ncbi:MAG: hypothetical protein AAB427_15130, partial [Chloroflexota bacterium]
MTYRLVLLTLIFSLAACSGQPAPTVTPTTAAPAPAPTPTLNLVLAEPTAAPATALPISASGIPNFSHIFVIVFENKEETSIVGNLNAPYFTLLAEQYARATSFYGTRHPSLPNYLALIGGSTFSISTNCTGCPIDEE